MRNQRSRQKQNRSNSQASGAVSRDSSHQLFGKYRGKVIDNVDLLFIGRLLVEVPALPNAVMNWAMPCVPYAGPRVGFCAIPPTGANVWVEFEAGDPSRPIWTGCFWGEGETPLGGLPMLKVFKTEHITMILNDTLELGGFTLTCSPPAVAVEMTISCTNLGITISCPESVLKMTEETLSLAVPTSELTLTSAAISVEADDINLTGDVSVEGAVEIEGDVDITGAVEVQGDVDITGAVEIQGDVEIAGAVEVQGNVEIAGAVEAQGNVNVGGALEVEGESNFAGAVTAEGEVNVAGALTVEGDEAVIGVIEGVLVPPF